MSFEFKANTVRDDPFDDEVRSHEHDTKYGNKCREQLISYAAKMFAHQHRVFWYSVVILQNDARILRWDRSGAVFTEKFSLWANPEILGEFLWRFSHSRPVDQGYDLTATLVPEDSEYYHLMTQVAETKLAAGDYVRQYFRNSLIKEWPWWRLRIDEELAYLEMDMMQV
ncbi:hypothetical protein SCP_0902580 [Sparassis crispa]|uniref:Fungal-type protein kinase domain-containing protein n=1 Tax=Sparassis crispa TaxID=139825 RepID=A0A401GW38_9APHY|nr:hypothetical protein SCP_0902580 [Sparassis crispa]GBE86379.1 hypothetical protein SCP_0902580 [Sparassis crispa]